MSMYQSFFLTCWLKLNYIFPSRKLFVILFQSQIIDCKSQNEADSNNYFTSKHREKARCIGFSTKAKAIYAGKKAGHYYQKMTGTIKRYLLD